MTSRRTLRRPKEAVPLPDARLAASRKFGRYKDESEKAVKPVEVVQDKKVEELIRAFFAFRIGGEFDPVDISEAYTMMYTSRLLKNLEFSQKDLDKFMLTLPPAIESRKGAQEHIILYPKLGLFLSALTNNSKRKNHVIDLRMGFELSEIYPINLEGFGFKNRRNVKIKGDVGDYIGWGMKKGILVVEGNAGNYLGEYMSGGKIIVKGNVETFFETDMLGGEIHVHGEITGEKNLHRLAGHGIYHKGKLIK